MIVLLDDLKFCTQCYNLRRITLCIEQAFTDGNVPTLFVSVEEEEIATRVMKPIIRKQFKRFIPKRMNKIAY